MSGPVTIPPTPSVTSDAQKPERKSVAELPDNLLAEAGPLNVAAWSGHGRASVADLKVPGSASPRAPSPPGARTATASRT